MPGFERNLFYDAMRFFLDRPRHNDVAHQVDSLLYFSNPIVRNLQLYEEIHVHEGCVNCLDWDSSGRYLVSGSDDHAIAVYDHHEGRFAGKVATQHLGNIFSVKFLPHTQARSVITGAADCSIQIHDVDGRLISRILSHTDRVKRLAVFRDNSNVFLSSAEDGFVHMHDIRSPVASILVHLNSKNPMSAGSRRPLRTNRPVKSIAVSPAIPHELAVASNEPLVRIYDIRMIARVPAMAISNGECECLGYRPGDPVDHIESIAGWQRTPGPNDQVKFSYCPGHLIKQPTLSQYHATHVVFSEDGRELILNLGSEQIYLFNFDRRIPTIPKNLRIPNFCFDSNVAPPVQPTNDDSEEDLNKLTVANRHYHSARFSEAIRHYNEVIAECPWISVAFANRAAAYIQRGWRGDYYDAMRDCIQALKLNPKLFKAHFRLVKCLYELNYKRLALDVLRVLRERFPEVAHIKSVADECDSDSEDDPDVNHGILDEVDDYQKVHDHTKRFYGHNNCSTDIKEACFLGQDFIAAGSDDGCMYIWDKKTTNIVRIIHADSLIVNCVQPNPENNILATSGIDDVVRLWRTSGTRKPDEMYTYSLVEMDADRSRTQPIVREVLTKEESSSSDPFSSGGLIGLDETSFEKIMAVNQTRLQGTGLHDLLSNLDVAELVAAFQGS